VPRTLLLLLAVLALIVSACGSDGGDGSAGRTAATAPPVADVDFPRDVTTLTELQQQAQGEEVVFAPSVSVLERGENRLGFALFDVSRAQVDAEAVALYTSRPDGEGLEGPFVARRESLRVAGPFQSRQTQADLDEIDTFWVADVPVRRRRGRVVITALASVGGELRAASRYEYRLSTGSGGVPEVGDPAIRVHTETPEDVGGDLEQIDTRLPPLRELHEVDFADVVGREPVVLQFATPQLCQTRVCGPVVDVMAEVRSRTRGVNFIHQEIYRDNDIQKGFRPPVAAWRLPTEPWTFVIDRRGRVVERFEGALSVRELEEAVRRVGQVG